MLKLVPEIVGIQVSCSAEDHSAVWDGRFPVSNYSKTSLYIAGHLLPPRYNQAIKQPLLSYLSTEISNGRKSIPTRSGRANMIQLMICAWRSTLNDTDIFKIVMEGQVG